MARKPNKKRQKNPAGCAGEIKQSKENIGEEKNTFGNDKFDFMMKSREEVVREGRGERVGYGRKGGDGRRKRSLRFKQVPQFLKLNESVYVIYNHAYRIRQFQCIL